MKKRAADIKKLGYFAIIINVIQIVSAVALAVIFLSGSFTLSRAWEVFLVLFCSLMVIWGAALDIRDAMSAREIENQREELKDAYENLEKLNITLRKQRHDFLNHIQVIYSLTEMYDRTEALKYMDEVYPAIQKVGAVFKTKSAAINALIASKMAECDTKGIEFRTEISADMSMLPVDDWEFCRVLGNLIDNAIEATAEGYILLSLAEDVKYYRFFVENTGEEIKEEIRDKIFETGFSTKGKEHGMGLAISKEILEKHGGTLKLEQGAATRFTGSILKRHG